MHNTNLIKMQNGELSDFIRSVKSQKIIKIDKVPKNYGLAPRTNLIKLQDGRIADFIKSLATGKLVIVNENEIKGYSLSPLSDIIQMQDGSLASFIETFIETRRTQSIDDDFLGDEPILGGNGDSIDDDFLGDGFVDTENLVPIVFNNLAYGYSIEQGGYFNKDGTVTKSSNFSRIRIPVEYGKKYRMKATGLDNMTGYFCGFDSNGKAVTSDSNYGVWKATVTTSTGLKYREIQTPIPSRITEIGISFKSGEGHGQQLMVWVADDKYNPKPNDYYESDIILGLE